MMVSMGRTCENPSRGNLFLFYIRACSTYISFWSHSRLRWWKTFGSFKYFSFGHVTSELTRLSIVFHFEDCSHHNLLHRKPISLDAQDPKSIPLPRAQEDNTRAQQYQCLMKNSKFLPYPLNYSRTPQTFLTPISPIFYIGTHRPRISLRTYHPSTYSLHLSWGCCRLHPHPPLLSLPCYHVVIAIIPNFGLLKILKRWVFRRTCHVDAKYIPQMV